MLVKSTIPRVCVFSYINVVILSKAFSVVFPESAKKDARIADILSLICLPQPQLTLYNTPPQPTLIAALVFRVLQT